MDKSYAKIHTDKIEHRKCLSLRNVCVYWMCGGGGGLFQCTCASGCMHVQPKINWISVSADHAQAHYSLYLSLNPRVPPLSSTSYEMYWSVSNIIFRQIFFGFGCCCCRWWYWKRSMLDLNSLITANIYFFLSNWKFIPKIQMLSVELRPFDQILVYLCSKTQNPISTVYQNSLTNIQGRERLKETHTHTHTSNRFSTLK